MRAELLGFIVWKFPNFRCHDNGGWSDTNFSLTQLIGRPRKTPVWRKNLDDISYTSWVIADFLIKFTNFCYHGNKGGSSENLNDSVWSANPKTPSLVQNSGTYLTCELSYVKFCLEIPKFSFPWQQGLNWQTPKTPNWCKNLDDISYTNWDKHR